MVKFFQRCLLSERFENLSESDFFFIRRASYENKKNWTKKKEAEILAQCGGSKEHPDWRNQVEGKWGSPAEQTFATDVVSACIEEDPEYRISTIWAKDYIQLKRVLDLRPVPDYIKNVYITADIGYVADPTAILIFGEFDDTQVEHGVACQLLQKIICTRRSLRPIDQADILIECVSWFKPLWVGIDTGVHGVSVINELEDRFRVHNLPTEIIYRYQAGSSIVVGFRSPEEMDQTLAGHGKGILKRSLEIKAIAKVWATKCLQEFFHNRNLRLPAGDEELIRAILATRQQKKQIATRMIEHIFYSSSLPDDEVDALRIWALRYWQQLTWPQREAQLAEIRAKFEKKQVAPVLLPRPFSGFFRR